MNQTPEVHDLIQRDVDGRLTEAERKHLSDLLAADPAAREEHRSLENLRDMLAGLPKEEPPGHLRASVLREIRAKRSTPLAWSFGRFALGYAYAAAAGAALAILGVHIATGGRVFGPNSLEPNAAATIGNASFLSYRSQAGNLAVDVDPPGKGSLDIVLTYDPASFELLGISNKTEGIGRIEATDGQVQWSQERPQRVTVLLAPRKHGVSRVDVKYRGQGGNSGGGTLELPGIN
jgi:hypothetical protein